MRIGDLVEEWEQDGRVSLAVREFTVRLPVYDAARLLGASPDARSRGASRETYQLDRRATSEHRRRGERPRDGRALRSEESRWAAQ